MGGAACIVSGALGTLSGPGASSPTARATFGSLRGSDVAWVALLTIVGAGLRFYKLDSALWYDEILTLVESVRAPLGQIVTAFPGDNHHPLYSVLAHLSIGVWGETPWALRLPAALFGVGSLPVLYLLGRTVTRRLEAAAASLILMVSYHHVWFSQNARGYTAVLFCVLLSTYAIVRWLDTRRSSFLWLYAVVTAAGAYAHLTTVLVAVAQAAACGLGWLVARGAHRPRESWIPLASAFLGAAALTLLVYAPMALDVGAVMADDRTGGGEKATLSWTVAAVLQGLQVGFGTAAGVIVGAVILAAGIVSYLRQRPVVALLFGLPVVVTVAAALILGRPVRPRFLFFSAGFALLFVVRGGAVVGALAAQALRRPALAVWGLRGMVVLLTAAAVGLSLRSLPYGYRYPKQDYGEAVALVERLMRAGDPVAVVGDGGEIPVVRYLHRPWTRIDTDADLRRLREDRHPVWVLSTFPSYIRAEQPGLWATLSEQCAQVGEIEGTIEDGSITIRRCP